MFWLVCFDISDDRARRKIGNVLGSYGDRVQESVFEITTQSARELVLLQKQLNELCGDEDNDVRFYRLCGRCQLASHALGVEAVAERPTSVVI